MCRHEGRCGSIRWWRSDTNRKWKAGIRRLGTKKESRYELAKWTLWQTEAGERTGRGSAEPSEVVSTGACGAWRRSKRSGTRGAAGIWKRGVGEGNDSRRMGLRI